MEFFHIIEEWNALDETNLDWINDFEQLLSCVLKGNPNFHGIFGFENKSVDWDIQI